MNKPRMAFLLLIYFFAAKTFASPIDEALNESIRDTQNLTAPESRQISGRGVLKVTDDEPEDNDLQDQNLQANQD